MRKQLKRAKSSWKGLRQKKKHEKKSTTEKSKSFMGKGKEHKTASHEGKLWRWETEIKSGYNVVAALHIIYVASVAKAAYELRD